MKIGICAEKFCLHDLDINLGITHKGKEKHASLITRFRKKYLPFYSASGSNIAIMHSDERKSIHTILSSNDDNIQSCEILNMFNQLHKLQINSILDHKNFLRTPKYFLAQRINKNIDAALNGENIKEKDTIKRILKELDIKAGINNQYFHNNITYSYQELSDLLGLDDRLYENEEVSNRTTPKLYEYNHDNLNKNKGIITAKNISLEYLSEMHDKHYILYFNFSLSQIYGILEKILIHRNNTFDISNDEAGLIKEAGVVQYCDLIYNCLKYNNAYLMHRDIRYTQEYFLVCIISSLLAISAKNDGILENLHIYFIRYLSELINQYSYKNIFNIDGVRYSLDELTDIIELIKKQIKQSSKNKIMDAQEYDNYLKGVNLNPRESVHAKLILALSDQNLKDIQNLTLDSVNITADQIISDIRNIIMSDNITHINQEQINKDTICNKFKDLFNRKNDLEYLYERAGHSLGGDLEKVCKYIYSQNDTLKKSLQLSLIHRLQEMIIEDPCTVGQLQRILDIPSGIDDRLNTSISSMYIEEDLTKIAAKIQQSIEDEFKHDINIQTSKPEITEKIQFEIFEEKARHMYLTFLRVSETEVERIIKKLKPGFFIESEMPKDEDSNSI